MGVHLDLNIILAYAFGLLLLYIIGWLLARPIKFIVKLVYNGIIGGVMLYLLNIIGSFIGLKVAINPVTALIAGFLGIPGVILIIILQYLL